jgi:hypothetical protein
VLSAVDAMGALWDKPLEAVERTGDETLTEAVDVAARAIERGEATVRDGLTIAFAAGTYFASMKLSAAGDPPPADDAEGS